MSETVLYASPAVPVAGETIVLWSSVTALGAKKMREQHLSMMQFLFLRLGTTGSAANGLKPYGSTDGGTNWRAMDYKDSTATATMPVAVAALAAGANKLYSFDVTMVNDFKLEFTADATTAPATWELVVTGIFGAIAVQK